STSITTIRQLNIVSNTLYFSTSAGNDIRIGTAGTQPPPTTNGTVLASLPGVITNTTSPFAFGFFTLGGGPGLDTLYYIDSSSNFVYKYSFIGGTNWANNGSILTGGAVGLTGRTRIVGTTTNVDLWITGGGGTLTGADSV